MTLAATALLFIALTALAWFAAPAWLATVVLAGLTAGMVALDLAWPPIAVAIVLTLVFAICATPPIRRALVTNRIFDWFRKVLPSLSDTEREALESGTTWWDAELFSGRPDWSLLSRHPKPALTDEEQAFVDGPTETLCRMLDQWQIGQTLDLPEEAWRYIREQGFLGMIIDKEYGGLGFSSQANAAVVTKLASCNLTAAVSVMVPNSLGPGELLHYFGTPEQKKYYLPRLARGEEIPCFALTSPLAGSDAASMPDTGVVCMGQHEGREVLGLRVSFDKRYITLAPVATVIGLAFKTLDPDGLLGGQKDLGITCALIPAHTPGVEVGNRHLPSGAPFMNGTIRGRDVFIPMDWVIGGRERVGQGWSMLMHCLSAGRAISLPAQSVAGGKACSMMAGAYARVRYQFKQPIGRFEGVQEPLARIGGEAYRMEAAHKMTLVALDQGQKPAVLSAILKANLTEANRRVVIDAMDIHGGKAVVTGPRNYLAQGYHSLPVSITVEGANILTRSMIIFGQGAIRCHPWLLKEMLAATSQAPDARKQFDRAFFGHIGFTISNTVRAMLLGLTGGRISRPAWSGPLRRDAQRITRLSAAFTLTADITLLLLGGRFKFAESLSGRFADALSHLYLASAVIKRFDDDGRPEEDLPLVRWAIDDSLHRTEEALYGVLANFPSPLLGRLLRVWTFPWGRAHRPADDRIQRRIAELLMSHNPARERLIDGAFRPTEGLGAAAVLKAFDALLATEEAERAVIHGCREVPGPHNVDALAQRAVKAGIITEAQADQLIEAQRLVAEAIAVDEFAPEALPVTSFDTPVDPLKKAS